MQLRDFAEELRQLRIATIHVPEKGGFTLSNGTWMRAMEVELYYEIDGLRSPAGMAQLFYLDTDQNARSPEAQLIRAGVWESYEAGWLIASIKGNTLLLAKVTPLEKVNLDQGWITSSGQLILKRE